MILKQTLRFEVYPHDLDGEYMWDEAVEACKNLGDGWRLPTREELYLVELNKRDIDGFTNDCYWSSSEHTVNTAWYQDFYSSYQEYESKCFNFNNYILRVRPVRDVKQNEE